MNDFRKRAEELRACESRHYNCAQAVVIPFAEKAGYTEEMALRFAANFGGGMKMASVCGAITGGLMALGLFGVEDPQTIGRYFRTIKEKHDGYLECADLLRINKEQGKPKKPHCDAMVFECVDLVAEILEEKGL